MIEREEWSLVAFTLLSQMALGLVLLALLASATTPLPFAAAVALALALLLSLLHLGSPAGAPRALRNLRASWLSREILLTGAFALLTTVSTLLPDVSWLLWLAAVAGVAAVAAMSAIYMRTVKPAWTTFFTPISFFTATLMLGVGAAAVLGPARPLAPALNSLAAGTLALQVLAFVLHLVHLGRGTGAARAARERLLKRFGWLAALRYLLGLAGVTALALAVSLHGPAAGAALYGSAGALLVAELLGRVLFYAAGVAEGVGRPRV